MDTGPACIPGLPGSPWAPGWATQGACREVAGGGGLRGEGRGARRCWGKRAPGPWGVGYGELTELSQGRRGSREGGTVRAGCSRPVTKCRPAHPPPPEVTCSPGAGPETDSRHRRFQTCFLHFAAPSPGWRTGEKLRDLSPSFPGTLRPERDSIPLGVRQQVNRLGTAPCHLG